MKINKLLKYDYISFDVFDTLVKRNTRKCKNVFLIVEKIYNEENEKKIDNFYNNRINAEIEANKQKLKEEITLDEIYDCLQKYYPLDICLKLKNIEITTEINICVPNKDIIEIYKELLKNNKNVIITSDMYLNEETIKKILQKCGIENYKKLYLSSTIKKRKSTGTIFDYIISDLNIKRSNIIHMGDNIISDYIIPNIKGIKAIHIKENNNLMFYNKKINKNRIRDYEELEHFISNNIEKNINYFYQMGYETFGPILYGFSKFIEKNIKDINKTFFLSRDGYIMQKAFNIIEKDNNSHYFYASRRALITTTLWQCQTLKEMLDKLYLKDYVKIGNLFRKLGLEEYQFSEIVKKHNYDIKDEIKYEELLTKRFLNLFEDIKPIIHKNSKEEFNILLKYMEQEKFEGEVSIVDIGWNGNMQKALVDISKIIDDKMKIEGYYLGVVPESKNIGKINMKGFLFESESNPNIYLCEKLINPIFESMFLASHGSVKKYIQKEDGKIVPELLEYEYKNSIEKEAYQEIQKGALKFVDDFNCSDLKKILEIDAELSFYNLMKFAYKPSKKDIKNFGDFKFLEEDITYIAKPKKIIYYFMHPTYFLKDLYNSGWIIGFLMRITKINIFYKQMYLAYIHFYLKKRKKKMN